MTRALAFGVLLIALSASAEPASVVRDFYAAWASGDVPAAAAHWTRARQQSFLVRETRAARARCLVLHRLAVGEIAVEGDAATVNVEAFLTRWSAKADAPVEDQRRRTTLTLRREGDDWKIASWKTAEEQLADALLALDDREQRQALLETQPELRSVRLMEAVCQRVITLANQKQRTRAAQLLEFARGVAADLHDPAAQANVLTTESVLRRLDPHFDYAGARRIAQEAVALAEQVGDPDLLVRTLMRNGRADRLVLGVDHEVNFHRALALADFVEDPTPLAHAASQLAPIYEARGYAREGLRYVRMAAHFADVAGDETAKLSSEMNLGGAYRLRRDFALSLAHYENALALAERLGFPNIRASVLTEMARADQGLGSRRFLEWTDRALAILGEEGSAAERLYALGPLAEYHIERGDLILAEEVLRKAEPLVARLGPSYYGDLTWSKVQLEMIEGDFEAALAHFGDASSVLALADRALIHGMQGRDVDARCLLAQALEKIERDRNEYDHLRHRGRVFPADIYAQYIESLVFAGELHRALEVGQRMKARVLHDLLASQWTSEHDPSTSDLNARIADLNRRLLLIQRDGGDVATVRVELRRVRAELDEALSLRPHPPAAVRPPTIDVAALDLPRATTIIDYVVGKKRITAFILRRDGDATRVEARTLAIRTEQLESLVRDFVRTIELRDAKYTAAARRLYDILLQPLIGPDPPAGALCVIPNGILWNVPFQALITPRGEHVVERAAVYYAPSLSLLIARDAPRAPGRAPTVLALGDPAIDVDTKQEVRAFHRNASLGRLPDASAEIDALRRIYGSRVTARTGLVATESTLKKDIRGYDVVHLATHGIVEEHDPLYSALLLAGSSTEDGLLEAREILSLPVEADLVVLSACDSARGEVLGGEGVLGLSWAFLATGCPRTVATQWRVGSAAAARLMVAFHRRMARLPAVGNVAGSLRDAQLELLRSDRFRHPYYWAGFVLVGRDD